MAEVRHDPIGDVVEVIIDIDDTWQWGDFIAFDKGVGHRIAGREAARHRYEVGGYKFAGGLRLDLPNDFGNCHPVHRIVVHVAAGVKCRLKGDAADCWMLDRKFDETADLMFVDVALDGGNDGYVQADLREPVQGAEFFLQNIRLAAYDPIGIPLKAVELEIQRGPYLVELFKESIVPGDALAVGVDHNKANTACLCGANEIDNLWMYRRLAAGKLQHLGPALGPHIIVEHLPDFLEGQAEAGCCVRKAERAIHVASTVDLDDAEAGVLFVVRTEPAIVWAAQIVRRTVGQRYRAGLVITRERDVSLGVAVDERHERPALRATLTHIDFVVAQ